MKKIILTGTVVLALAGASLQSARAGDREWATAGKVLTGVAVVGLVAAAIDGRAHADVSYSYGAPAYCPPPAPVCYYNYCPPPQPACCPPPVPPCNYGYYAPQPVAYYPHYPPPAMVYRQPVMYYPQQPRVVYYRSHRGGW